MSQDRVRLARAATACALASVALASLACTARPDGTIYGLARHGDTAPTAVLAWPRDRSEPMTIAVPLDLPRDARLTGTGNCLRLAGSPRHLLVGHGGALERADSWQRIEIELSESIDLGDDPGPALSCRRAPTTARARPGSRARSARPSARASGPIAAPAG